MVRVQKRIFDGLEVLQFFTTRQWDFRTERFFGLYNELTPQDQHMYVDKMSWSQTTLNNPYFIDNFGIFIQIQHGHRWHSRPWILETQYFGWSSILSEGTIDNTSKSQTSIESVSWIYNNNASRYLSIVNIFFYSQIVDHWFHCQGFVVLIAFVGILIVHRPKTIHQCIFYWIARILETIIILLKT